MLRFVFPAFLLLLLASGCTNRKREEDLRRREADLAQREQQLVLREQTIALKEQSLDSTQHLLDSARLTLQPADTAVINPALAGNWQVQMNCIETSCPGSAIGDTKTEQWELCYEGSAMLAKASANNKLVRVYTGQYNGRNVLLVSETKEGEATTATRMVVRLSQTQPNRPDRLDGRREITRADGCRIVYAVALVKQSL